MVQSIQVADDIDGITIPTFFSGSDYFDFSDGNGIPIFVSSGWDENLEIIVANSDVTSPATMVGNVAEQTTSSDQKTGYDRRLLRTHHSIYFRIKSFI